MAYWEEIRKYSCDYGCVRKKGIFEENVGSHACVENKFVAYFSFGVVRPLAVFFVPEAPLCGLMAKENRVIVLNSSRTIFACSYFSRV